MKERPILFSASMIQAILAGRKSMTRRIMKPQPKNHVDTAIMSNDKSEVKFGYSSNTNIALMEGDWFKCPYGEIGNILWVRETWQKVDTYPEPDCFGKYLYKSMGDTCDKWKPSIFMPKDACRVFLKITDIKVERVQDISEEDAIKEGVTEPEGFEGYIDCGIVVNGMRTANFLFKELWQSINGEESWNSNPWCWCVSFERTESPATPRAWANVKNRKH